MFLQSLEINEGTTVSEIVTKNYRTADVFRSYGIEYCCGGKWPLRTVCEMKGLEFEQLKKELQNAGQHLKLPSALPFESWPLDFLTSYIINIHHHYLKTTLPVTEEILKKFSASHSKKYPALELVSKLFTNLRKSILPHIQEEEEILFPYIRQIATAYKNKDSYGKLLVKTLRKPIELVSHHEHGLLKESVFKFRELTNQYTPPDAACVSHKLVLARLRELDDDLIQHIRLENEILFPKALAIERELLK
jgi:regulator of cell morphogenesis and NO signaling